MTVTGGGGGGASGAAPTDFSHRTVELGVVVPIAHAVHFVAAGSRSVLVTDPTPHTLQLCVDAVE